MGKRGFELSANFIVMLILATVALSLGIVLIKHVSSSSTSLTGKSYRNFMNQLRTVSCDSTQKTCVAPQSLSQYPGKPAVYSLQINNNFNKPAYFEAEIYEVNDNGDKVLGKIRSLKNENFGEIQSYSSKTFPIVVVPILGAEQGNHNVLISVKYSFDGSIWKNYSKELVQLIVK